MIGGLAVLLLFQLAGEILVQLLALPVPGPVVGMILLFVGLVVRNSLWPNAETVPTGLASASAGLLSHLALLFVPAGTGIIVYVSLLRQEWLAITAALVGSTILTIVVTALAMQSLVKRRKSAKGS